MSTIQVEPESPDGKPSDLEQFERAQSILLMDPQLRDVEHISFLRGYFKYNQFFKAES